MGLVKKYKHRKTFTFDGKRYNVYADTLEQLAEKKVLKLAELKENRAKASTITVRKWTEQCIEIYKTNQSDITREKYVQRVNHCILEHIGDYQVRAINPMHCQRVMNLQQGKSKTQINEVYQALKFIFSHAVYNDIITKDPTRTLIKPKGTSKPRRALTDLERELFLEIAPTDRKFYAFLLMYYCGCRPLEACECKGSDLFILDGHPMLHIRGTKTKNADRNVPVPHELWEIIKSTPKDEYIALYGNGNHINPDNRKRLWRWLWNKMNIKAGTETFRNKLMEPYLIPKDLTPYCLRHDFCSRLAKDGVDIRIAQKLMGHSDIKLTANVYTHVDDQSIITALNLGNVRPFVLPSL